MSMVARQMAGGLVTAALALAVQAATYTWDGGSTADSNWSSDANWNPDGAPVSTNDTLVQFTGNTRLLPNQNIATPFVLNRLDFLGGATYTVGIFVGGNQLQFVTNGVTHPRIYLDRNASCAINNPIEIPAGATLYAQIGTYGVTLGGAITGGGSIDKQQQAGGLSLNSSANTFSGGLTVRAINDDWYKVNINASSAMGTGPVSLYGGTLATNKVNPGGLNFYNTTTHTNPVSLYAISPIFAGMPNGSASVTLNGTIDLNTYTLHLRGGGAGTIGGVISEGGANALVKSDAGTWTLGAENTFTGTVSLVNGTLKLGAAGSLTPQVALTFSCATGWSSLATATFDLNGRNQAVSRLDGWTTHPWLTNILTSATAATLVVDQSTSTVFNGRLAGALSLVKTGAGTLTLSNCPSATSGGITVSNGTLAVAAGASLGASSVTAAGGRLELNTAAAVADAASLSVMDSAKVLLAGGATETVDKLFVNGVQQPRGSYGVTGSGAMYADDAHFEGAGLLYVTSNPPLSPTTVTWDAEGGADTLLSSATNWVGDALPLFDGTNRAVFATGGITATVDTAANFYGLSFNRDGTFVLAAGAGVISNGAGGITASAPTTASRAYAVAEDLVLTDNQTWHVATNTPGVTALSVSGSIDDVSLPCSVTKTGFGSLALAASNTFDGTLTINEGDVSLYHSCALGSTNGSTVVNGSTGGRLLLNGNLTIEDPLVLNGEKNNSGTLIVNSGSNVLSGPLTCYSQVRFSTSSPLVVVGGATADNNGLFVVNSGVLVTFKDKPLNLGTRTFWADSGGTTVLAAPGNTWADMLVAGGKVRCEATNVLPASTILRIGVWYAPGGTLDLNGYDQTVGRFYLEAPVAAVRTVTSATPARLTVNQASDSLVDARFTGAVSLLKLGGGALTLTNAFTTTSGSFAVSNGTLLVTRDGTFGSNSMSVAVGGTGTLTLSNSVAIADSATLTLPSEGIATAKVNLADGVNEAVRYLYFGGKNKRAGTYGSKASAAVIKDNDHFSGTGILTVLWDHSGTLIKLQ